MKALVVFESMFGNTQKVAVAIADGLAMYGQVDVAEVGEATTELDGDIDLLVVGGPTHAFGLSRESSRQEAAKQTSDGVISQRIGLREWLPLVKGIRKGMPAATFDTRLDKVRKLPGSAARRAAKQFRHHGLRLVVSPKSFYVTGMVGPLAEGELDRARRWGGDLGAQVFSSSANKAS